MTNDLIRKLENLAVELEPVVGGRERAKAIREIIAEIETLYRHSASQSRIISALETHIHALKKQTKAVAR